LETGLGLQGDMAADVYIVLSSVYPFREPSFTKMLMTSALMSDISNQETGLGCLIILIIII